jgi:hypothetical protein
MLTYLITGEFILEYNTACLSKSINESFAHGGETITIRGLGFKADNKNKSHYRCRFGANAAASGDASIVSNSELVSLVADDGVDAEARLVSEEELMCTVPLWRWAAGVAHVLLLECSQASCSTVPNLPGANSFLYIEEWFAMTERQGAAKGNQRIDVFGLGFTSNSSYKCVFVSPIVIMATGAQALNSTHASCLTPLWAAAGHAADVVQFQLHNLAGVCRKGTCAIEYTPATNAHVCDSQCERQCATAKTTTLVNVSDSTDSLSTLSRCKGRCTSIP